MQLLIDAQTVIKSAALISTGTLGVIYLAHALSKQGGSGLVRLIIQGQRNKAWDERDGDGYGRY